MVTQRKLRVAMHCAGCENTVQNALRRTEGVISADADHRTGSVHLRFDDAQISREQIRERIRAIGFETEAIV